MASPSLRRGSVGPQWLDLQNIVNVPSLSAEDFTLEDGFRFPSKMSNHLAHFRIKGERWTLDKFINEGGFGKTYLATHEHSGKRYVIKFLTNTEDNEVKFLSKVPYKTFLHPNVVTYVAIGAGVKEAFRKTAPFQPNNIIIMKAIPGGEFFDTLVGGTLTEPSMRRFAHDLVKGMDNLVQHNISHKDLKPDNLLLDVHGRLVIIDLGNASLYKAVEVDSSTPTSAPAVQEEMPSVASSGSLVSFHTESSKGTPGYLAPEARFQAHDAELADVFTVGLIFFMMRKPVPPQWIHTATQAYSRVVKGGLDPSFWRQLPGLGIEISEDLRKLIDSLVQLEANARPRFADLAAACDKDEATLSKWPSLAWLAGEKSDPLEFVLELVHLNPEITLKSNDAVEQIVTYIRSFLPGAEDIVAAAGSAFDAADLNGNGLLTNHELMVAIDPDGLKGVSGIDLAAFMRRYTDTPALTREQFQKLAKEWQFGGREIVHRLGRNKSRCFAFIPRPGKIANEQECEELANEIMSSCQAEHYNTERLCEDVEDAGKEETSVPRIRISVTMLEGAKRELCRIRCNVYHYEDKLILETKVRWGSIIEEMAMLKVINDHVQKQWGDRVSAPEALTVNVDHGTSSAIHDRLATKISVGEFKVKDLGLAESGYGSKPN